MPEIRNPAGAPLRNLKANKSIARDRRDQDAP